MNLQSPAVGKGVAKLFILLLEIEMEADSCFPLDDIKFCLLPYILKEGHRIVLGITLTQLQNYPPSFMFRKK